MLFLKKCGTKEEKQWIRKNYRAASFAKMVDVIKFVMYRGPAFGYVRVRI